MNHHYRDIRDKAGEPLWWDENAVPRYCEFGPRETANIYAREAALVLIRCQDCGAEFKVAFSYSPWPDREKISDQIKTDVIHYGDPPNADCCPAGPTMNSVPVRVLEFWTQTDLVTDGWRRVPDLEREIDCEWAT